MSPFWTLLRGMRGAVELRRRVQGPKRPSWDATFEALAEIFHQGSRRIVRMPLEAQRRSTNLIVTNLPSSPLYKETHFERVSAGGVPAEWFRRHDAEDGRTLLYIHGGAYALGSIDTHRDLVARICRTARASALSIDYRLAPEYKFPAQLEDCSAAYRWLLEQGVDPSRLVIAGDSAGGALTLSTLVNLRDSREPMPAAGVCLSPWCDLDASSASMLGNAKFDYVNQRAVRHYAKYFVDPKDVRNPLAAPIHADLHGLPPLLIQVGGAEALLDDAVTVTQHARDVGVDAELDVWTDMIHVWQLFAFLSPQGMHAIDKIGRYVVARTGGSARDAA